MVILTTPIPTTATPVTATATTPSTTSKPQSRTSTTSLYPGPTPLPPLAQKIKFRLAQAKAKEGDASFADMEKYVGGMAHFNAPLPDGNVMRFEILKEENAAVKRAVPGQTYVVVSAKPVMSAALAGVGANEGGGGHPPLEEMDWHGTFVNKGEAERRVRAVLEQFKGDMEGGVVRMSEEGEEEVLGCVSGRAIEDGMRIVQVTLDHGRINDVIV